MMTGKNDDAASTREDQFLAELIPQAAEHLAEQHAGDFNIEGGRDRFLTWLTAHTEKPAAPVKGRAGPVYARPKRIGWIKRFLYRLAAARPAIPAPDGQFLIWLSGARKQILAQCPTERPKYAGLGAAILISGVMASVSLAFALMTALNAALWVALPVAFAWGVVIVSLDRLFVVSLTRGHGALGQLFRVFPRLVLALLMGFVISTPLVLQIFRPEIQHQITVLHNQAATTYYEQAETNPLAKRIAADQAEVNNDLVALGQAHSGEQAAALQQEVRAAQQELRIDQAAQQQQARAFTATNQDNTGLLIRLQALDTITANNATLAAAWWLLVALLVVIECTPVLVKMLLNLGPMSIYERMLADEEETQLQVTEHNRAVRRDVQMRAAEAMAASERMVLAGWQADIPDVAQDIIATRRRVEAERLRKWEKDQMLRLAEGGQEPGAYVQGIFTDKGTFTEEIGYRGSTACAAAGITYKQLDYWARTGLVVPSVRADSGSGTQRLYSFRDILVLKVVERLLDTGISLQQIRVAVQHLRDRGTEDLAQVTLMSDGVSVYECTSADEVEELLQGGQGVFGIALGRIGREVEDDLAMLPAVRAEDGSVTTDPGTTIPPGEEKSSHDRMTR